MRPRLLAAAALAVAVAGCALVARPPQAARAATAPSAPRAADAAPRPPAGTPDAALGLSKTSPFDVPSPPPFHAEDSTPGERPPPPRAFPGAPPVVPHGFADFLPITRDQNACLDCHGVKEKKPGEPTPIPASHYVDLRRAPGPPRATIAGARQICTACHATRSDAPPLVGSSFAPGAPTP